MFDTYSKRRKKREQVGQPDVYQYDNLPQAFRNQVIWIWVRAIGPYYDSNKRATSAIKMLHLDGRLTYDLRDAPLSNQLWNLIVHIIAEETGQLQIGEQYRDSLEKCCHFLRTSSVDLVLDILDLSFRTIDTILRSQTDEARIASGSQYSPDEAIRVLNLRFKEHGIGYEFVSSEIIRIDDQYVHENIVKPALLLLSDVRFKGANDEFLRAHEHYRKQEYKDAIVDAGNAFESTMKTICDLRAWGYPSGATASTLIKVLIQNGFIEDYYENILIGLATLRNKTTGAHGQGSQPITIPARVAAQSIHLAAANIVFLLETLQDAP